MCDEYVVAVMDRPFNLQGGRGYMYLLLFFFLPNTIDPHYFFFQILH